MGSLRKKYLINRHFQLKTTFSLIGFVAAVFALLVFAAGLNLLNINDRITNLLQFNTQISGMISVPSQQVSKEEYASYIAMQGALDKNKSKLDEMIRFNKILIMLIIGIVVLQGIVLFYILIRQTHRIAGPIYVMTGYMKQIIAGHIPDKVRALRRKDFFQEDYKVFSEMVEVLKKREKK